MNDDSLFRRVLEYIETEGGGSDAFQELALAVFGHQFEFNAAYRVLVQNRGIDPRAIRSWVEIPPVSTVAFKRLRLACGPTVMTFRTSGTTRGADQRGAHHLSDLRLYRAALRRQFKRWVLPDLDSIRFLSLTPQPMWAPESSLGFMMSDLHDVFGSPGSGFFLSPEGVRLEALIDALQAAEHEACPVCLAGVAFAFVQLLDALQARGRPIRLPAGSRIMDTGGFKGRSRSVERSELLVGYAEWLGVPANRVVNEYGMTELGSQFYDGALWGEDPGIKRAPHWVRTQVIDAAHGVVLPEGRTGLLRHFDLANLDSVLAVETEDLGYRSGEGFVLLGRAENAEPRGCSLVVPDPVPR